jgi:4-hydroxybenzoate polyprenyltransferase
MCKLQAPLGAFCALALIARLSAALDGFSQTVSGAPTDSQQLHAIARIVRGAGWLLGFVILVLGAVMAVRAHAEVALVRRVTLAAAVLAVTSTAAWLISRCADRTAARQSRSG